MRIDGSEWTFVYLGEWDAIYKDGELVYCGDRLDAPDFLQRVGKCNVSVEYGDFDWFIDEVDEEAPKRLEDMRLEK